MKYYKIDIKTFYDQPMQYVAKGDTFKTTKKTLQIGRANGELVPNGRHYFDRMGEGEIIKDAPVFDSFFLKSFDKKIYWEWRLQDVHGFIGEYPTGGNWYISTRFKELLEQFNIAKGYHFYPTKLLYKGEKLDYWIFQHGITDNGINNKSYLNYQKTEFFDESQNSSIKINNSEEFVGLRYEIGSKSDYEKDLITKKIVLNEAVDFIPFFGINSMGRVVSERLKQAIETAGLEGFEFSEIDYEIGIG